MDSSSLDCEGDSRLHSIFLGNSMYFSHFGEITVLVACGTSNGHLIDIWNYLYSTRRY